MGEEAGAEAADGIDESVWNCAWELAVAAATTDVKRFKTVAADTKRRGISNLDLMTYLLLLLQEQTTRVLGRVPLDVAEVEQLARSRQRQWSRLIRNDFGWPLADTLSVVMAFRQADDTFRSLRALPLLAVGLGVLLEDPPTDAEALRPVLRQRLHQMAQTPPESESESIKDT